MFKHRVRCLARAHTAFLVIGVVFLVARKTEWQSRAGAHRRFLFAQAYKSFKRYDTPACSNVPLMGVPLMIEPLSACVGKNVLTPPFRLKIQHRGFVTLFAGSCCQICPRRGYLLLDDSVLILVKY